MIPPVYGNQSCVIASTPIESGPYFAKNAAIVASDWLTAKYPVTLAAAVVCPPCTQAPDVPL